MLKFTFEFLYERINVNDIIAYRQIKFELELNKIHSTTISLKVVGSVY